MTVPVSLPVRIPASTKENTLGVILAGGLGRRMASPLPKALIEFRSRPMITHVIDRLGPQVHSLVVNANTHAQEFAKLGLHLVPDITEGFVGPLAGLQAVMFAEPRFEWYLLTPCDSPFLPLDLAAQMAAKQSEANQPRDGREETTATRAISVSCEGQEHPVFALVHRSLRDSLDHYLAGGGRKIDRWYAQVDYQLAVFTNPFEFLNFNTPQELAAYQG